MTVRRDGRRGGESKRVSRRKRDYIHTCARVRLAVPAVGGYFGGLLASIAKDQLRYLGDTRVASFVSIQHNLNQRPCSRRLGEPRKQHGRMRAHKPHVRNATANKPDDEERGYIAAEQL